jgi:hypothetical protein
VSSSTPQALRSLPTLPGQPFRLDMPLHDLTQKPQHLPEVLGGAPDTHISSELTWWRSNVSLLRAERGAQFRAPFAHLDARREGEGTFFRADCGSTRPGAR